MEIVRLRLEPTDFIVIRVPHTTARTVYENLSALAAQSFPETRILILDEEMDIEAMPIERLRETLRKFEAATEV